MKISPLLQTDFYKQSHYKMYPEGTTKIYSNLTPRKSRIKGINHVVVFGIQYMIAEYIINQWNEGFFKQKKEWVLGHYKNIIDNTLGKDSVDLEHISKLHDLGYMPLHIKALPEGTLCPIGVPLMTITNTVDHAYWLVNFLETIISSVTWMPITAATLAFEYKKILTKWADKTCDNKDHIQWQAHDFSMRGLVGLEAACLVGSGHLLSFTGTDTIPAIQWLIQHYHANPNNELVGASVPATEHSVMCMGEKDSEQETFERLLDLYPNGILSVVSDTWDLWKVLTVFLPNLKENILSRNGKLVIRPDSGDPVRIITGYLKSEHTGNYIEGYPEMIDGKIVSNEEELGVIELLWETFGGTINSKGYKVLDSHVGCIYGDSITQGRAEEICKRLEEKGFASSNIVLGVGSYTYQYNTRDTFGFAVKATYGEVKQHLYPYTDLDWVTEGRAIFKDPITDDGTKKSAKGLLLVSKDHENNSYCLHDNVTIKEEEGGELLTVFYNGEVKNEYSLQEVRNNLNQYL